jgi:hypothetical protein
VVAPSGSDKGDPFAFAGVYDGHGEHMQQQHMLHMHVQASLIEQRACVVQPASRQAFSIFQQLQDINGAARGGMHALCLVVGPGKFCPCCQAAFCAHQQRVGLRAASSATKLHHAAVGMRLGSLPRNSKLCLPGAVAAEVCSWTCPWRSITQQHTI